MADTDAGGVTLILDPAARPPACPDEGTKWFRTHPLEGGSLLLNEEEDYFRDPLEYYLSCLDLLRDRGAAFLTWHDVLDDNVPDGLAVIVQFDVDGGPKAFRRIADALVDRGIRATAMVHREAHDWYAYRVEDLDIEWLQGLQAQGWAVGYHNNSIGNVQRRDRVGDYSPSVLAEATARFAADVQTLREWFDLRTFTHHGGNSLNKLTPVPDDAPVCVDRRPNPEVWEQIAGAFSDGGFLARPTSLRDRCEGLGDGLHFFRNHPVKYGNYKAPFDLPPIDPGEAPPSPSQDLGAMGAASAALSAEWLDARATHRVGERLSEATHHRLLTDRLVPFESFSEPATRFRARRRRTHRQRYPWAPGDPHVYWWRLLATFGAAARDVLNVGALPPASRDETTTFLRHDAVVTELDIDEERQPDVVGSITDLPTDLRHGFDLVLLFGLPSVSDPAAAITGCMEATRLGGRVVLGFAAHTHPFLGGRWFPDTRPIWRRDGRMIDDPSLRTKLWSFDSTSVDQLLDAIPGTTVECWGHYWWAVVQR